jgi:alkylation response protein AidB-like acyl-CoA dehydrogenase
MDFATPEGYEERKEAARQLAREHVAPSVAARDRAGRWDPDLFREMGAAGLLGTVFPREYGGEGLSPLEWSARQEGFGAGGEDAGLALAWSAHTLQCGVPLWHFGTETQRERHLPGLCRGDRVGALADGTAESLSAPTTVRARPLPRGAGWVLDGRVALVVNAPVASVFVVTAVTDADRGQDGVSAFIVEWQTPGLVIGPPIETLGLRTALRAEVRFEGCEIPCVNVLGAEGTGLTRVLRLARRWERGAGLAPWIGLLQRLLERSLDEARERSQCGKALGSFQSVRAVLADMKIRLELCRRMQARASWQLGRPDSPNERDAAAAWLFISESARWIARAALELHGPSGCRADQFPERAYRDTAQLGSSGLGNDVLRSVIAGSLMQLG